MIGSFANAAGTVFGRPRRAREQPIEEIAMNTPTIPLPRLQKGDRWRYIAAAITGLAPTGRAPEVIAERAIAIADAVVVLEEQRPEVARERQRK